MRRFPINYVLYHVVDSTLDCNHSLVELVSGSNNVQHNVLKHHNKLEFFESRSSRRMKMSFYTFGVFSTSRITQETTGFTVSLANSSKSIL